VSLQTNHLGVLEDRFPSFFVRSKGEL